MQGEGCREADNQAGPVRGGSRVVQEDSWPDHPSLAKQKNIFLLEVVWYLLTFVGNHHTQGHEILSRKTRDIEAAHSVPF